MTGLSEKSVAACIGLPSNGMIQMLVVGPSSIGSASRVPSGDGRG